MLVEVQNQNEFCICNIGMDILCEQQIVSYDLGAVVYVVSCDENYL